MNGEKLYNELREYYEGIGRFIVTFSVIENFIGLTITKIENKLELSDKPNNNIENQKIKVTDKINKLDKLIEKYNIPTTTWNSIKGNFTNCNYFRRFISHGIYHNELPNPHIMGYVLKGDELKKHKLSKTEIKKQLEIIVNIESGKQGLGVFTEELNNWLETI